MNGAPGFTIHATKMLLDRVKQPLGERVEPASALGNWYSTALFWKPQVALFVNERTFLPVFVPLAPAIELGERFPVELRRVLDAHGVDRRFIEGEIGSMGVGRFAKTASRSVLGVMSEFAFLARMHRERHGEDTDLVALSVRMSETPTGPLYKRHVSPDRELQALVAGERSRERPVQVIGPPVSRRRIEVVALAWRGSGGPR